MIHESSISRLRNKQSISTKIVFNLLRIQQKSITKETVNHNLYPRENLIPIKQELVSFYFLPRIRIFNTLNY